MSRFIIEGEWTGYRSGQQRIVHRTVHKVSEKSLRAWVEKTHAISYTDGTCLLLSIRDAKPRERVKEIRGYVSLIRDCCHHDVDSVSALYAKGREMSLTADQLAERSQYVGASEVAAALGVSEAGKEKREILFERVHGLHVPVDPRRRLRRAEAEAWE